MAEELRLAFHQQLGEIEKRVVHLFALVGEGLVAATQALLSEDSDVARLLSEREGTIDFLYRDVEATVNQQLARQAPVAEELRYLLTVLRVVPELERSHDLVEHIAIRGVRGTREELSPRARGMIDRMGRLGAEMWRQTAVAWADRDAMVAYRLSELDDEMDDLHASLTTELGSGDISIPVVMDMVLVARFYERLGDHAVNVARRIAYLAGVSSTTEQLGSAPVGTTPADPAGPEGAEGSIGGVPPDFGG